MDNQPITPEPCCKNDRWFKISAIIIGVLIVFGLFGNIYVLLKKQTATQPSLTPTPTTIKSPSISSSPTPYYGKIECHENEKYFVIVGNQKTPGFIVKYKTSNDQKMECSWIVGKTDFVIGIEWAEYYLGLTNDFLLLDSGTGPGIRGLIIYNLPKREKVFTDGYQSSPLGVTIQKDFLIYWISTNKEVTTDNCPEVEKWKSDGLRAIIVTKVKLDLSTLTKVELGEYQCMSQQ